MFFPARAIRCCHRAKRFPLHFGEQLARIRQGFCMIANIHGRSKLIHALYSYRKFIVLYAELVDRNCSKRLCLETGSLSCNNRQADNDLRIRGVSGSSVKREKKKKKTTWNLNRVTVCSAMLESPYIEWLSIRPPLSILWMLNISLVWLLCQKVHKTCAHALLLPSSIDADLHDGPVLNICRHCRAL